MIIPTRTKHYYADIDKDEEKEESDTGSQYY